MEVFPILLLLSLHVAALRAEVFESMLLKDFSVYPFYIDDDSDDSLDNKQDLWLTKLYLESGEARYEWLSHHTTSLT